MPFNEPVLDEILPDRKWLHNLSTLLQWKEDLLKLNDGDIFYLDVDHPYYRPFYKKFGLDILELTRAALFDALDTIHKGKKIAAFHFSDIKVKIKEDTKIKMRSITTKHEGIPLTFNAVIIAVGRRQAYPVSGVFVCPDCGEEEAIFADKQRKFKIPVCTKHKFPKNMELKEGTMKSELIQDIVIQEPIDEIVENQPIEMDAKLVDTDVGTSYMGQKKKITGIFRVEYDTKGKQKDIYMDILSIKDLDDVELIYPKKEEIELWKQEANNEENFKEKLIGSFAPHIFGYRNIKLALLLSLVSLRGRIHERRRGWVNALLVGDPGMAKSMLLEEVEKYIYHW